MAGIADEAFADLPVAVVYMPPWPATLVGVVAGLVAPLIWIPLSTGFPDHVLLNLMGTVIVLGGPFAAMLLLSSRIPRLSTWQARVAGALFVYAGIGTVSGFLFAGGLDLQVVGIWPIMFYTWLAFVLELPTGID